MPGNPGGSVTRAYPPGMPVVLAVLLAVTLGAPFGPAEARAVDDAEGLVVEVEVQVDGSWEAVLVRPFSSFDELPPTALLDRGDGTWAGSVALPTADDWSIVFDAIDPAGETERSRTTTLVELGVDPVVVAGPPAEPIPSEPIPATTWWLIGGIVLAAAALGALAWWTFSDDPDGAPGEPTTDDTDATDEDPSSG